MARYRTIASALNASLKAAELGPKDRAAVRLLQLYAERLDEGRDVARLGPALLTGLNALGLTPIGAVAITGKGATAKDDNRTSPLDELRARRAARLSGAPAVDAATP